nr:hypothetical protein [Tanacetum cinerariifolium]
MTHLVTSLTPDSANSCVMQGASCTQRKVSMVLFVLPFVLLLVVIVVTIVIVLVILIFFVFAIVGVVVVVLVSSSNAISKLPDGSLSHNWCCGWTGLFPSGRDMIHNELSNSAKIDSSKYSDLTGDEEPSDEDEGTGMGD